MKDNAGNYEIELGVVQRYGQLVDARNNIFIQSARNVRQLLAEIQATPQQRESAVFRIYNEQLELFRQTTIRLRTEARQLREELETRIEFGLDIDPNLPRRLEQILRAIKRIDEFDISDDSFTQLLQQQAEQEDALRRSRDRV